MNKAPEQNQKASEAAELREAQEKLDCACDSADILRNRLSERDAEICSLRLQLRELAAELERVKASNARLLALVKDATTEVYELSEYDAAFMLERRVRNAWLKRALAAIAACEKE